MHKKVNLFDLKQFLLESLNAFKSQDIVCMSINKKNSIVDFIIICTGQSNRQVISIAQDIFYKLRTINFKCYKTEGLVCGEWILIDLGNIIIHVMQTDTRKLYSLEKLWNEN